MAMYIYIQTIALTAGDGDSVDFFNDFRHRTADGEQSEEKKQRAAPNKGMSSATAYSGTSRG